MGVWDIKHQVHLRRCRTHPERWLYVCSCGKRGVCQWTMQLAREDGDAHRNSAA